MSLKSRDAILCIVCMFIGMLISIFWNSYFPNRNEYPEFIPSLRIGLKSGNEISNGSTNNSDQGTDNRLIHNIFCALFPGLFVYLICRSNMKVMQSNDGAQLGRK